MSQLSELSLKGVKNMDKYISSINELNLGKKINGGSCSDIYEFTPSFYFKKFTEDYEDLTDEINIEFYETIKYLSEIKGMPYIVTAQDIYRSQESLFGYSMRIIAAKNFRTISDETHVRDILNGFKPLRKDVRVLSENHVKTEDIGGDNILYNGFMYLIDLDLSLVDKRYIPDELYERTMNSLFCGIKTKLLDDPRYNDTVQVDDWENYFNRFVEMSSTVLGEETTTINDLKRGYQKIKTLYKI